MTDPFSILGLPRTFDIDTGAVRRAYLARSSEVHPDLAAGDPEAARGMAALNEARAVLENPEKRANALLALLGGPRSDQDRSLPEGFLFEIMETRQEIEGAVKEGRPEERGRWERWAEEQRRAATEEVSRLFSALSSPPGAGELGAIRTRLNAWRYIERLIEQLDPGFGPVSADGQA